MFFVRSRLRRKWRPEHVHQWRKWWSYWYQPVRRIWYLAGSCPLGIDIDSYALDTLAKFVLAYYSLIVQFHYHPFSYRSVIAIIINSYQMLAYHRTEKELNWMAPRANSAKIMKFKFLICRADVQTDKQPPDFRKAYCESNGLISIGTPLWRSAILVAEGDADR